MLAASSGFELPLKKRTWSAGMVTASDILPHLKRIPLKTIAFPIMPEIRM
jgi:hypothetical protein